MENNTEEEGGRQTGTLAGKQEQRVRRLIKSAEGHELVINKHLHHKPVGRVARGQLRLQEGRKRLC